MKTFAAATFLVAALALSGCGDDSTDTATTDGTTTTVDSGTTATTAATDTTALGTTKPAASGPTVKIVDSSLGRILADSDGNTLYVFTPDTPTTSACNAGCDSTWPPVPGPANGDGIDADDLGTVTRDDGTSQAAFYGHPVYAYAGDQKPGDTTGQGVGGKWFVIDADGNPITGDGSATTTTARAGY